MRKKFLFLSLAILLVLAGVACHQRDKTVTVADDDPEMLAAMAKARETLPQFWEAFQHPKPHDDGFGLKVKVTDGKAVEFFWLSHLERKDGQTFGTIDNDPDLIKNVKLGDRRAIPEEDIADWLYLRDGKMLGNYTIRVLFKQMPAGEVAKYKQIMAEP